MREFQLAVMGVLSCALVLLGTSAVAQIRADDDTFGDAGEPREQAAALDRAARRIYPGGRDEQELKPQSDLPAPSRGADGGGAPGGATPRAEPAPD